MTFVDTLKMVCCLNDNGLNKVNELLKDLISNPKYLRITPEQLEAKEMTEEIIDKHNEVKPREEQKLIERKEQLKEQYKREFRIMDRCIIPWMDNKDILKAIDETSDTAFKKIFKSFEWGYIQGKRAERARRKKVNTVKDGSNIPVATLKQIIINRIKAINDLKTLQDVYSPLVEKDKRASQ